MQRRGVVAAIIVAFLLLVGLWGYFAILHKAPSCSDFVQNQDEEGVDCGGVCARMCVADLAAPQVTFVRSVVGGPGRTDVIAYIDNPNQDAKAEDASYRIELYDANNAIVATKEGTVDLPPKRTPLYVPNLFSGSETNVRAFLTIDDASLAWYEYEDTRVVFGVRDVIVEHADTLPRIRATLDNPSNDSFKNVRVVITVFDEDNNAIAASQTVIPEMKAEGKAEVVFTWNSPFSGTPARQEIIPIFPDPS